MYVPKFRHNRKPSGVRLLTPPLDLVPNHAQLILIHGRGLFVTGTHGSLLSNNAHK